jgi:hypothetical protein
MAATSAVPTFRLSMSRDRSANESVYHGILLVTRICSSRGYDVSTILIARGKDVPGAGRRISDFARERGQAFDFFMHKRRS